MWSQFCTIENEALYSQDRDCCDHVLAPSTSDIMLTGVTDVKNVGHTLGCVISVAYVIYWVHMFRAYGSLKGIL